MAGENLKLTINHGMIRAAAGGPSVHVNNHYIQTVIHRFRTEVLDRSESDYNVLVLHAYPWTGNIPGYINNLERAKDRIRNRAQMLNPNQLRHNSPVSIVMDYASKLGVHIILGPLYEIAGPKIYKTTVMATPDGDLLKYRAMCLPSVDRALGINPGKRPGVFDITMNGRVIGRIGIFIDEDLVCPEIFRAYRMERVDAVIGHMLPYKSDHLKRIEEGNVYTMHPCMLDKFLTVRAIDAGAPVILVGGVLTVTGGGGKILRKYWSPTTIVDPEGPGIEACIDHHVSRATGRPFLTLDDVDSMKRVVVARSDPLMPDDHVTVVCRREYQRDVRRFCNCLRSEAGCA